MTSPVELTGNGHTSKVTLYCADCLEVLPTLTGIDAVVTDPPYGCNKSDWDTQFFSGWYDSAKKVASRIIIITGSVGLKDSIRVVGGDFVDVIAARNLNGMTRTAIGFGNWIAAVVVGKIPQGINFFEFVIHGEMPTHPSPKPIDYMVKLIGRVSSVSESVCDPMMGSGTTGVACVRTGRNFIGIEKEPKYFDIAVERIKRELDQGKLL